FGFDDGTACQRPSHHRREPVEDFAFAIVEHEATAEDLEVRLVGGILAHRPSNGEKHDAKRDGGCKQPHRRKMTDHPVPPFMRPETASPILLRPPLRAAAQRSVWPSPCSRNAPCCTSGAICSSSGHRTASRDRKSTRLNSSHVKISYVVLCLQKNN